MRVKVTKVTVQAVFLVVFMTGKHFRIQQVVVDIDADFSGRRLLPRDEKVKG